MACKNKPKRKSCAELDESDERRDAQRDDDEGGAGQEGEDDSGETKITLQINRPDFSPNCSYARNIAQEYVRNGLRTAQTKKVGISTRFSLPISGDGTRPPHCSHFTSKRTKDAAALRIHAAPVWVYTIYMSISGSIYCPDLERERVTQNPDQDLERVPMIQIHFDPCSRYTARNGTSA